MIRCLVVDDEPASRDVILKYIDDIDFIEVVGVCKNALEANTILKVKEIDLIFLDINMPKLSGLQFYKSLQNPPKVIFTTAYPEFAIEGFDVNATDYLLKPFSFERFLKAVNKYLDSSPSQENTNNTLYLKADKKLYRVDVNSINYLESLGDYVKVSYQDTNIIVHDTLRNLMDKLSESAIVRVHKSFAISIKKFEHIEGNSIIISSKRIPIGPSYKDSFLSLINTSSKTEL